MNTLAALAAIVQLQGAQPPAPPTFADSLRAALAPLFRAKPETVTVTRRDTIRTKPDTVRVTMRTKPDTIRLRDTLYLPVPPVQTTPSNPPPRDTTPPLTPNPKPAPPLLRRWALLGLGAQYEARGIAALEVMRKKEGSAWAGNYYDRAATCYAFVERSAALSDSLRAVWKPWCGALAVDYLVKYVVPAGFNVSPHWSQPAGLVAHFRATGDTAFRDAVLRMADKMYGAFYKGSAQASPYLTRVNGESRILARVVQLQRLAYELATTAADSAKLGARLDVLEDLAVAWQAPDGSFPADGQVCGGQLNYMIGLLADELAQLYQVRPDPRLPDVIRLAMTYVWQTQWRPADLSFNYASVQCPNGGLTASPDLNGEYLGAFKFLAGYDGDPLWLARADAAMTGALAKAFWGGSKQLNELLAQFDRYAAAAP